MKSKVETTKLGKIFDFDNFVLDYDVAEISMGKVPSIGNYSTPSDRVGLHIKFYPYDIDKTIVVETNKGSFGEIWFFRILDESKGLAYNTIHPYEILKKEGIDELKGLISSDTLKQISDGEASLVITGGITRDSKTRALNEIDIIINVIKKNKMKKNSNLKLQDIPFDKSILDNFGDVDNNGFKSENSIIIEFPQDPPFNKFGYFIVLQKRKNIDGDFEIELEIRSELDQSLSKLSDFVSEKEREKLGLGDMKLKGEDLLTIAFQDDEYGLEVLNDFLGAIKNTLLPKDKYGTYDDVKNNPSLKELSNDLLNIAFLDKDERASRLGGFNILVKNADIPEDVKKLTTQIVDLLKNESEIEKIDKIETIEGLTDLVSELSEDLSEEEEIEESDIEELENILNKI
tara:strand:- start:1323 stop:2528 length:1206 start_codon:yes stop_codon:yes gene_type:complete